MSADFAVERIIWLHKRISEGYYPNAMRLSERFGISHRQAQRDCEYLRRQLCAPVAFDRSRQGYYYTEDFSLPESIRVGDQRDYAHLIACADQASGGEEGATQLSIPYSAVLEIPDKLTALELGPFVTRRVGAGNKYYCEFYNVRVFLGALLAADAAIRIVEPEWLRERLCESLDKLAYGNRPIDQEGEE